ncbi:MAG: (2Fe-2S)-binding protein [Candidatus Odyssella sp.]|nr:(2Fe-2S)-binding protein [Candidatus Odyssella sp.]
MSLEVEIAFTLNGRAVSAAVPATASALTVLRERFDLAGAKLVCGEGECGACTIIVDGLSRNSCLMPAVDLAGRTVRTVEGLWGERGLDPVQQAFVDTGAVQCGYCTAGMVMQIRHALDRNPAAGEAELRRAIEGNVCRCTGYAKVIEAALAAGQRMRGGGAP